MSYWFMYLIVKLDSISFFSGGMIGVGCVASFILIVAYVVNKADGDDDICKAVRPWLVVAITMLCIGTFSRIVIPTTKEAAVIYLLPKIVNSEMVSELEGIPKNLARLLDKKTEQWLGETLGVDKEEKKEE